jgi:predicted nuclease with TOPRIM domain
MDPQILKLARELQAELSPINDQTEVDRLESIHGKLIELMDCLEAALPKLREKRKKAETKVDLAEAMRRLRELTSNLDLPEGKDSLEQIIRELRGDDPADPVGVPAKKKPGPKGLTGGVALPLPDSDSKRS